jgi:mRNA interferase MazF
VKRGDLFWAELAPRSGSEQQGRRPVIILSHDAFNQASGWRSVIVIPLSTSHAQGRRGPTVVPLSAGTAGLAQDACALCHQITTLDRAKCTERLGALPERTLKAIETALLAAVDTRA